MTDTNTNETTPDQLMKTFEGKSLKSIILFTIVVHAALLIGTSTPYIYRTVFNINAQAGQLEEVRMASAVKEAQAAIRDIADHYGVKPQDLSNRFADNAPKATTEAPVSEDSADPVAAEDTTTGEDEEPDSLIEQDIQKAEKGPELPPVEDEDLFK